MKDKVVQVEHYARIINFAVGEALPSNENQSHLPAKVIYQQQPSTIFGDDIHSEPVESLLIKDRVVVKATKQQIASLHKEVPHSIKAFIFTHIGAEPIPLAYSTNNSLDIEKGEKFNVGIQLCKDYGSLQTEYDMNKRCKAFSGIKIVIYNTFTV